MNGIDLVVRALHQGECGLARDLLATAERHHADHEVHHVATDLAHWSQTHARRLAEIGQTYRLRLKDEATQRSSVARSSVLAGATEADSREPGLLLLRDLCDLHLAASENSLHWEMLAQAAQAAGDARLLELAAACHPRCLRQMRWTNTMIKDVSPQILTSL